MLHSVKLNDFTKGAITAIFGAVFMALYSVVNQAGFDIFTVDYNVVLQMTINGAIAAFMGYLSKNFFTDANNQVDLGSLGKYGDIDPPRE